MLDKSHKPLSFTTSKKSLTGSNKSPLQNMKVHIEIIGYVSRGC